ncbi:Bacterial alpha-L-rhamnosidase [Candidatus Poribacteria bacterium]|nr:Bacterial alpha-L-rhamnosidase [Candidatus Poribacteria bacterium]
MTDKISCKTDFPKSRKWKAKWIWQPGTGQVKNAYFFFRKCFNIDKPKEQYKLYIAADTRYQLFINGNFTGRGAPQSQPFLQYYDVYNLEDKFIPGENCIAVIVNYVGNIEDTRGGLLMELTGKDGEVIASTDTGWRVIRSNAWQENTHYVGMNQATPYQEFFDVRRIPKGWMKAGFNDSEWTWAITLRGRHSDRPPAVQPWSFLVRRDIPFMMEKPVFPVRIEKVEESLDLVNRSRSNDLAPGLSMVGQPVKYSTVTDVENLCSYSGITIIQSSTNHLNLDFDGMYAPAIILDFGKVITARAELNIEGSAGGTVDIGYAERLIDGNFNIAMECEFADRYIMKEGMQRFESFTWKSFRYMKLRFRKCLQQVKIHSIRGVISTYPYEEKGKFESSDKELNQIFEISRETIRLCSNEFLMDTPWREQAQWLGDVALVTLPAIYACFGDEKLTGKFLRQSGSNQHPTGMISNVSNKVNHSWQGAIPDYSLWWVMGLWYHYIYTGHEKWINQLYPQALRVIYAHINYVNKRGLIEDMPYWVFIDWSDVDRAGECTAYNAIFYGALEAILKMAQFKGDIYTQKMAQETMSLMKANFQERLFDPERGCFADACIDGVLSQKISEHGNFAAINWDLCNTETAEKIISAFYEERSIENFTEAQPFFMTIVLRALDHMGRFDLALRLIHERWGKRMVAKGVTSVLEEWYENGSWRSGDFNGFLRTHSHAWSAIPAEFLIKNLMGLEILEPGCGKIKLNPEKTDFDYHAVFPTPKGLIEVNYESGKMDFSVPDSIEIMDS